ncbi:ankyrin-3 [Dendrobium catenatum]|uniref:E3 ubiquitin-protein ligase XBAT32 n=1 Tax=Dendrobium catenatum TaxID=906689 RepID=A0A2I0WYQ0_9ASPA|nr:ankyrin-3 [Dendrobium catenatum]PKU80791.1 E3 ubiquitin-protein ligase XBAT32 [Dendrobium catenatum]
MGKRAAARAERTENELALPSQRLVEAALNGEVEVVEESLAAAIAGAASEVVVDVNYIGTVNLRVKCSEVVLGEERADEVRIGYEEFRTDVSALFSAAHSGHVEVVRKLLSAGADVNQEFFRGYAITAAAREGHCNILGMLLKAGVSQSACEDALLEASLCGEAEAVQLLIQSEMVRADAAAHALVTASSRGFLDVVAVLVENGVDINRFDRVLLRSIKPTLHANVDCTPLVAAIVSKQNSIVKYLLEAGASTACLIQVSAWSWDPISGEEMRVGVCLGEPYNALWCAVEFYEASGEILKLLLHHCPFLLEDPYLGRTVLCHAILCQNSNAIKVLLDLGANSKFPLRTKQGHESYPIHLAARIGNVFILKQLISHGCDVNAKTSAGETPLMVSAKADHAECFLELVLAGADLGLLSHTGYSAIELAERSAFSSSIVDILSQALFTGATIHSSNPRVFSPLHFIAGCGRAEPLQMILNSSTGELNKLDSSGLTPVMVAAIGGHLESFRLLVMAGADLTVRSSDGNTIMSILQYESIASSKDYFEKVLLDGVLGNVISNAPFKALHYAARKGDASSTIQLLKMGYNVNSLDENGYSPLMLSAMEGHSDLCKILLVHGSADSELINGRKETALSLARCSSRSNKVTEDLLLDHVARFHVLVGEELCKHTREGRGNPHMKAVRMLKSGVLSWGKTNRRNVACKEAAAGPSLNFVKNWRKDSGHNKAEIFRVVTVKGREVHFEASCVSGMEIWVRGINLITKEANSGVT